MLPNLKKGPIVVMDRFEYLRLLSVSISDTNKVREAPAEGLKTKGRPPKYYHPPFHKEKLVEFTVRRIPPESIASVRSTGSRLAHLYGLPKTHKKQLAMRPILSASGTYKYVLAKRLDSKLKPLSWNEHTVIDIFEFANDIRKMEVRSGETLV